MTQNFPSYPPDTAQAVYDLHLKGLSSRKISELLGISKSTVNNWLNKWYKTKTQAKQGAKILFLDFETAASEVLAFGRRKVNITRQHVVKEGGWILCGSYSWLDEDKIGNIYLDKDDVLAADDSELVIGFYDLLEQADAVVAHNGKGYDHPVLQTRALSHGFGALPKVKVIDTYLLAKKHLRLPSYSLDYIAAYFGLGEKIDTGGIDLWKRVQAGDKAAMKEMVKYCDHDVRLLKGVYKKLRALGADGSGFKAGLYYEDGAMHCPTCGSTHVNETGRKVTTGMSVFSEYECDECGSRFRDRENLVPKEVRANLLVHSS